jgi:hypothetical protein
VRCTSGAPATLRGDVGHDGRGRRGGGRGARNSGVRRRGGSREVRAAHGLTWAGPRRKRGGQAQMNSMVLNLFKSIQTSLN